MRFVSRDDTLAPGACFICTAAPSEGQGLVDTSRNFEPFYPDARTGRIYVCQGCASGICDAVGFVSKDRLEAAEARANEAEWRFRAAQDVFKEFSESLEAKVTERGDQVVSDKIVAPAEDGGDAVVAAREQQVEAGEVFDPEAGSEQVEPEADPEPSPEEVDAEEQADEGESVTTDTLGPAKADSDVEPDEA